MRNSRLYTPQPLIAADSVELAEAASHYLVRVLRMSVGDPVVLFNGDGWDYSGQIDRVQRQCVSVKLSKRCSPGNESDLKITLVQAISRGERMDYSLQKATELGVSRIQTLTSQRVEVRLSEKVLAKRLAHWQGVVISACEQSGRAIVPDVIAPISLAEWVASPESSLRLVLDPQAGFSLTSLSLEGQAVSILVGPEGGLSPDELKQARTAGITAVSLGPRVLRTETAGPAAIAVLQANAGDF